MVPQGHAPVLGHIFGHPDIPRLHLPHLVILAHLQILFDLAYFASGHISLDFDLSEQFANNFILSIREHKPVALYPRGRVMQLDICLADFVAGEIDCLFEQGYIDLLTI